VERPGALTVSSVDEVTAMLDANTASAQQLTLS
jgi:hypothetical protein